MPDPMQLPEEAVIAASRASEYGDMRWPGDSGSPSPAECLEDARKALTAAMPAIRRAVIKECIAELCHADISEGAAKVARNCLRALSGTAATGEAP